MSKLTEKQKEEYARNLNDIIDRCGHVIQGVDGDHPYYYTIGLATTLDIEFVITGRPIAKIDNLLNDVVQLYRDGRLELDVPFTVNENYITTLEQDKTLARYRLQEVQVTSTINDFTMGMTNPRLNTKKPQRIFQILWGNIDNILPGEDGYRNYPEQTILPTKKEH